VMYGRRKSSPVIVVLKTANKAEVSTSVAESEKRRAGAEGIVRQQSTTRTQCRIWACHRCCLAAVRHRRYSPRWEPYAGKPHVRVCAGGAR